MDLSLGNYTSLFQKQENAQFMKLFAQDNVKIQDNLCKVRRKGHVIVICLNLSLAEPATQLKFSILQKSFATQSLLMRWECVLQDQGQYDPKKENSKYLDSISNVDDQRVFRDN